MTNYPLDGEGWVHVPDHDLGWVFKGGNGWFFSDTHQVWEYLPHLVPSKGVLDAAAIPSPAADVARPQGWPTWAEIWGTPQQRPGGRFRAALRWWTFRYPKVLMWAFLPVALVGGLVFGEGGVGAAMFMVAGLLLIPLCVFISWWLRLNDFSPVKATGVMLGIAVAADIYTKRHPRQPFQPIGSNNGYPPGYRGPGSTKPPWM